MINILRTHQRPVLIAVTVMTIIAFIWLYNPAETGKLDSNVVGSIYGRDVRFPVVQQFAKKRKLAEDFGLEEISRFFSYGVVSDEKTSRDYQFAWNGLVLEHEAEALGIAPTDSQAEDYIKKMPAFQTENQFDPARYNQFKANYLPSHGMTPELFVELVVLTLKMEKLKELIAGPVSISKAQVESDFTRTIQQAKLQAVVVPFEDLKKEVTLTEEDIAKGYEASKENLKDPAKREIEFVAFLLTEDQKKLTGVEKGNAVRAHLQRAREFSVKMVEANADFAKVAAGMEVTPQDGGEVIGDQGDKLPPAENIGQAVERLTDTDPNSDPIQGPDGFYVLHLKKFTPERQKTLDETKELVKTQLTSDKARELAKTRAEELRGKLEAALKEGKSFTDAATALGLKVEDLPPFSPMEPNKDVPLTQALVRSLLSTKTGALTKIQLTQTGYAIAFVSERLPIDEAKLKESQEEISQRVEGFNEQLKVVLFTEWQQEARKASGLNPRQG